MNRSQEKGSGGSKYGNANLNASTIFAKPPSTQRTGTALGASRVGGAMTLLGVPKVCSLPARSSYHFLLVLTAPPPLADSGKDNNYRDKASCSEASEPPFHQEGAPAMPSVRQRDSISTVEPARLLRGGL